MSRTTSIAGVRPLGWLARARARSVQSLGVGVPSARRGRSGAGANHGAWERAMIMRVSARSQAEDSADENPSTRQKLGTGRGSESAQAQTPHTLCQAQEP